MAHASNDSWPIHPCAGRMSPGVTHRAPRMSVGRATTPRTPAGVFLALTGVASFVAYAQISQTLELEALPSVRSPRRVPRDDPFGERSGVGFARCRTSRIPALPVDT